MKNKFVYIGTLLAAGLVLRFCLVPLLAEDRPLGLRMAAVVLILVLGAGFVLRGTAKIIEETTGVLSERTKLAGGLLQSFGTAFPDMALGVVAAVVSLRVKSADYLLAVNFAIIAAATTFGSNIYNIAHAAWCIFRQNLANLKGRRVLMFPLIKGGGEVIPMKDHAVKPSLEEIDVSLDILNALTLLTAFVAVAMVLFGRVERPPAGIETDLYQLIRPVGLVLLPLCLGIFYFFRKNRRLENILEEVAAEEAYYRAKSNFVIWLSLALSGAAILLAAESMVQAVRVFSEISRTPFVVSGALAGLVGCLGEMIVVHNFTVHPRGRIGDAIVGVAMDNIVTTMGASIVAIMGGIFLGGNALILIFVLILSLNTVLIWQIAKLKNSFLA